jgi:phenylalanyl-tRNA synthetase alpha chain
VPEIVSDAQLADVFGQDFADDYLQGVAPIVHRAGADRFLRPELDVPLLMQLRNRAGPMRVLSAGKVYRDEEPGRTRLQAFHQAELLLVDRGLGEWSFMDRLMQMLAVPNRRLRQEQVSFPLCGRAWEVEMEWDDGWIVVASWGKYSERAVRVLGNDPQQYGAVGVSFGLERLACLDYGIDDVRKLEAHMRAG